MLLVASWMLYVNVVPATATRLAVDVPLDAAPYTTLRVAVVLNVTSWAAGADWVAVAPVWLAAALRSATTWSRIPVVTPGPDAVAVTVRLTLTTACRIRKARFLDSVAHTGG